MSKGKHLMKHILLFLFFFSAVGYISAQKRSNLQAIPKNDTIIKKDLARNKVIVIPKEKDKADSILENPYYMPMVPSNKSVHFSMPVISGNPNARFSTPVITDSTIKQQNNKSPFVTNKSKKKVEIIKKKK
jgi:hypothetical protein